LLKLKRQEVLFNYSHFIPGAIHKFEDLFEKIDPEVKSIKNEEYHFYNISKPFINYVFDAISLNTPGMENILSDLGVGFGDVITFGKKEYLFLSTLQEYPKNHRNIIQEGFNSLQYFTPDAFRCRCGNKCFWRTRIPNYGKQLAAFYNSKEKSSKIIIKLAYEAGFVYNVKKYDGGALDDIISKKTLIITNYDPNTQTIFISDYMGKGKIIQLEIMKRNLRRLN